MNEDEDVDVTGAGALGTALRLGAGRVRSNLTRGPPKCLDRGLRSPMLIEPLPRAHNSQSEQSDRELFWSHGVAHGHEERVRQKFLSRAGALHSSACSSSEGTCEGEGAVRRERASANVFVTPGMCTNI